MFNPTSPTKQFAFLFSAQILRFLKILRLDRQANEETGPIFAGPITIPNPCESKFQFLRREPLVFFSTAFR